MAEVKKLFQLTQVYEKQGVKLSVEEGEAVVKFSDHCSDLLNKLNGKTAFDSEPAGYSHALTRLRGDE